MKVKLKLPDGYEHRHIRIFAGIEEIARQLKGEKWEIKTGRCSMCGKCCMNVNDNWRHGREANGWCSQLAVREGYRQGNGEWAVMCKLDAGRPFYCCNGDGLDVVPDCTIKWS